MVDLASKELDELRRELLARALEDGRVRDELAADGSLFECYHPRMEAVHRRNAARLAAVLDRQGWPGRRNRIKKAMRDQRVHTGMGQVSVLVDDRSGDPPGHALAAACDVVQ